jgi:hypothetical protein
VPSSSSPPSTTVGDGPVAPGRCPGCGAVLAVAPAPEDGDAADACRLLFEVTVRGLREDAAADPGAAAVAQLADDAYTAQHPQGSDPEEVGTALARLGERFGDGPVRCDVADAPDVWQTTIGDVAADLDVVDLPVLVETWARTVHQDWTDTSALRHLPAGERSRS